MWQNLFWPPILNRIFCIQMLSFKLTMYSNSPTLSGILWKIPLKKVFFVLFCFVFVLFCFVLFCFVLFCFVLFCFVVFLFVLGFFFRSLDYFRETIRFWPPFWNGTFLMFFLLIYGCLRCIQIWCKFRTEIPTGKYLKWLCPSGPTCAGEM